MAESSSSIRAAELPLTAAGIHTEIKVLKKKISEYNVRIAEARDECSKAEEDENAGRMLKEHLKYRTAWALTHDMEFKMYDHLLEYYDKTNSLDNTSVQSQLQTLITKMNMLDKQIDLTIAGCQHCCTMKMPHLVKRHDERQERLMAAKSEAAARLMILKM